ncbi:MAG: hypothetical protein GX316_01140 [Firmicutes bacterium]|nr:hypothetical protein [Bacillota bacterium]
MDYNFEWFDREIGAPTVTIAEYGLIFNLSAIMTLGEPEGIMLGFDSEQLMLAVRPVKGEEAPNNVTFPFKERINRGFARINTKDFVRYIKQYFPLPFTKSIRCVARWDEDNNAMLVDLTQAWEDIDLEETVSPPGLFT